MKTKNPVIKALADFIEQNPKCQFEIDNDMWYIMDVQGNQIATSDDYKTRTEWYDYGNNYGHALAEAMVELLNRRGFGIEASAV